MKKRSKSKRKLVLRASASPQFIPADATERLNDKSGKSEDVSRLLYYQFNENDGGLLAQLNGDGDIGQAFKKIVLAGYDADELEQFLCRLKFELKKYPLTRRGTEFPEKQRRKIARAAQDLASAVAEINLGEIFIFGDPGGKILHPLRPGEALGIILKVARIVQNALPQLVLRPRTSSDAVIAIMDDVRRRTGKPHFPEMAILIGAVCGRYYFREDDLKMLIRRRKKKVTQSR